MMGLGRGAMHPVDDPGNLAWLNMLQLLVAKRWKKVLLKLALGFGPCARLWIVLGEMGREEQLDAGLKVDRQRLVFTERALGENLLCRFPRILETDRRIAANCRPLAIAPMNDNKRFDATLRYAHAERRAVPCKRSTCPRLVNVSPCRDWVASLEERTVASWLHRRV